MGHTTVEEQILALERGALDRWSGGDPAGYAKHASDDVSYFDDIGASGRLDGIDAIRTYLFSLKGEIPPHDYEIENPRVQVYGDVGILTLRYFPSVDGQPGQPWKMTSVYHRTDGGWEVVHSHWSMLKDAEQPE